MKKISDILLELNSFVPTDLAEVESFRIKLLGKKGIIKEFSELLKTLPQEEKKEFGQSLNLLREATNEKLNYFKSLLDVQSDHLEQIIDFTKPSIENEPGSRHPISLVKNQIVEIFSRIGFTVSEGPEIEDDWHNFSALNFPPEHPARDMQDTFFIEKNPDFSLRTHTSSVQVRMMENSKPPIRTISPGRVFRNEAVSARAHCIFHQIEGLYIDKNVSFSDLKQVLLYFAKEFFGESTQIRLRPSYFPFTEPSFEMDVYWGLKTEVDHRITKGTGWLEILGCGMVDPEVLKNCNIDPSVYSGFAFGMGIERITMLRYQIGDLRMFFENDVRFLKQFSASTM